MTTGLEHFIPHVFPFLLVLFRTAAIFMFAPMFGSSVIPIRVKLLLSLALSVCIYPVIPFQLIVFDSIFALAFAVAMEMLIGLAIGYGASLPLVAMQVGGQMMGHQLGLGLAQVFNPEFNEQTEVLSQFLFMMALAIFLVLNGHHAVLHALAGSFESVPLGGYVPDGTLVGLVTGLLGSMFELGMRVAAPLLCLIFLETVAMGFVARTVPQLNILSLGFPLRILVGLFLLMGLVTLMYDVLAVHIQQTMRAIIQVFGT